MRRFPSLIAAGLMLTLPLAAPAATGGGPFAPALIVNGRIITNYEIAQRELFMQALEGPGDHHDEAVKALIDDKLRLSEAAKYGIKPTPEQIKAGIAEFASRGKFTADQFMAELTKVGIDPLTVEEFVGAGVVWRQVVQGAVAPTVSVTDADAKEAQSVTLAHGAPRLLLSELIMPATPDYAPTTIPQIEQLSKTLRGDAAFAAAARQYSASATAPKGGQLDWIPANQLPQQVLHAVIGLAPGQVSKPVALPNSIGIFEMRAIADATGVPASQIKVDYARYAIAGTGAQAATAAAKIRARASTCDDLYGVAKGQPAQVLTRVSVLQPQIPADVALALAPLDPGETTTLASGSNTVMLMLCSRDVVQNPEPSLEDLKNALFSDRVNAKADQKLDELRAAAIIRKP